MATVENTNATTQPNAKKKAAAFVNLSVVSGKKNGDEKVVKRLGSIPLYKDDAFHAAILKHVGAGGEIVLEHNIHVVQEEADFKDFF